MSSPDLPAIRPRKSRPGSRAITGGILVAIAVLGTYAATTKAGADHSQAVVVAAHDIAPGTRLQASDFRVVHMEIAPALADHVVRPDTTLRNATLLGPLRAGEVAQTSLIAAPSSSIPYVEMSFAIPSSRALEGALQPGETVDVLVTDKSAPTSVARIATSDARILRIRSNNTNDIGHNGDITITVGVESRAQAATIAAAVDQGQLTLVRTTGIAKND